MSSSESRQPKKQGFLQGAFILTLGALLAKAIGALFKIPLTRIITTEGAGHFNVAYNIYIVLLNVSSSGLPIAVSRLVSQAHTLGQKRQVQSIHRVSQTLFLVLGGVCGGAMFFGADALAAWMRDPDAVYAIRTLAPAVLFVCVGGGFRGYFQGQQYMTPTAVAQVLEALSKLLLGLAAVWLVMSWGWDLPHAAGASILGVTVGTMLSCLFFLYTYRRNRIRLTQAEAAVPIASAWETARKIIALAVPITIGATGLQIFNALGGKIILGQLQDSLGYSLAQASSLYGIYTMAQTLYLLPSSIVQPLTVSIIPAVTEALALEQRQEARRKEESAIRIAALIAMPAGVGLSVLSGPIQRLLYGYDAETLAYAGPTLAILGVAAALYCFILLTNSILQAHGRATVPFYATVAGGVTNLLAAYFLVGNPNISIYGAAVGTVAYCAVALSLNIGAIHALVPESPRFLRQVCKPLAAALVMGLVTWGVYHVIPNTILAVGVACVVYFALVFLLRPLTWYDCQLLPKGRLIARLLRVKEEQP